MKKIFNIFLVALSVFLLSNVLFAQAFFRVGEVPVETGESSYGGIISGVDFDGDNYPEIYTVNDDWNDGPTELIPKIYKYEYQDDGTWALVWKATLSIPKQNTWPALTYGDWDGDGKMELIWGPVNFTDAVTNPNPARIVVFEEVGDGSDNWGVPDAQNPGNWLPNAEYSLTTTDNANIRPFRWFLNDIDNDGQQELVMSTRAGSAFFVVGVSDIPDNGDGSETWTIEMSDTANAIAGIYYDIAVTDSAFYLFKDGGDVIPVTYQNGAYTIQAAKTGFAGGGSWLSSAVVDINGDNTKEILVSSYSTSIKKVYLLQGYGSGITSTEIADLSAQVGASGRLYGGATGDLGSNGNLDYVVGTRDAVPNAQIIRLEYQGGDITLPASYQTTVIDQEYSAGGRWMYFGIGNVDADPDMEVVYTEGTGNTAPLIVLDETGHVPVELTSFSASVVDGFVQLKWATATETNNLGFEVQRKDIKGDYSTVGFVDGNGTTTKSKSYSFVDNKVESGKYFYRLKQVDLDGSYEYSNAVEIDLTKPTEFSLQQNYPNPFNPSTTIKFSLGKASNVNLKVFNALGEEVATLINNEFKELGTYNVTFNAANLASGTYIYRLQAGDFVVTKKMNLLK